jgi:hypothetical protein
MKDERMAEPVLIQSRIANGRWVGLVAAGPEAPALEVLHLEQRLDELAVTAEGQGPGHWQASVAIPSALLSDGVQTFVVRDAATGTRIGAFSIVTGVPVEDDIRAEIELLRAEVDLLKKAFRRHCVETGG